VTESIRLKREQLEEVFKNFETLRQFELLIETFDTVNSITLIGLRTDIDTNTVKLNGIEDFATRDQTGAEIKALYEDEPNTNAFTDARMIKLSGIEPNATIDQTGAEIKSLYEAEANTNAFTDAEQSKLAGIEAGATGDQTGAEIKALYEVEANAFTDALFTKLAGIEAGATTDQTGAEIKALYEVEANAFTDALFTKLTGIEAGATGDQTGAEIKSLYEAEANAFTDALFTKLTGIEAGATTDQTGAEIKSLYEAEANTNAFTDAEKNKLNGIATGAEVNAVDSVNGSTGAVVLDADDIDDSSTAHKFTSAADISKLAGIEAGATTDQTGAEIKSLYEAEANTNAFTDAEKTKLAAIGTVKSSLTPTTGFSETVTQNSADKWVVLNPAGALASGTITLVAPGSATDGQEITISTTKMVSSITINGNGGTVYGAPSALAAESSYKFKFDSNLSSWFNVV